MEIHDNFEEDPVFIKISTVRWLYYHVKFLQKPQYYAYVNMFLNWKYNNHSAFTSFETEPDVARFLVLTLRNQVEAKENDQDVLMDKIVNVF